MTIRSYRDLQVYQRAEALVVPMHQLVASFPTFERYDLCDLRYDGQASRW